MNGTFVLLAIAKYLAVCASAFFLAMSFATKDVSFVVIAGLFLLMAWGYFAVQRGLIQRKNWARVAAILMSAFQLFSPLLPIAAWSLRNLLKPETKEAFTNGPVASAQTKWELYKPAGVVFVLAFLLVLIESAVFGTGVSIKASIPSAHSLRVDRDRDNTLAEWRQVGARCNSNGDDGCSRIAYEQALKYEPRNPALLANLGMAENRLGHHQEAAQILEAVIASGHPTYDVLAYYGMSLEQLGRTDEALNAYLRSLSINEALVDITQKATALLIRANRLDDAERLASDFVRKHPEASALLKPQLDMIRDGDRGTESATTQKPSEI